ncbi:hypothetical protein [Endozoicomonas sp.]|uniref:hypothetical protein n=1 Tax=Endozoicomonas sp. TaxID=1892382 RepID=UPI002886E67D|nr:hypothetical protein [Endozoicomonas sp.]
MSNSICGNQRTVPVNKDSVSTEDSAAKAFGRKAGFVKSKHPVTYFVYIFDHVDEKKKLATQEDKDYIKKRFNIESFKNIDVIPSKRSVVFRENEIQNYHPRDALECKIFTPEGGEFFLSSRNGGIKIPHGALSENVLVVIGGGIETEADPNNICDDEGVSEPRESNATPVFSILPDKYPLNIEATVLLRNLDLDYNVEKMTTLLMGAEGNRDATTDIQIQGDYITTKIKYL